MSLSSGCSRLGLICISQLASLLHTQPIAPIQSKPRPWLPSSGGQSLSSCRVLTGRGLLSRGGCGGGSRILSLEGPGSLLRRDGEWRWTGVKGWPERHSWEGRRRHHTYGQGGVRNQGTQPAEGFKFLWGELWERNLWAQEAWGGREPEGKTQPFCQLTASLGSRSQLKPPPLRVPTCLSLFGPQCLPGRKAG